MSRTQVLLRSAEPADAPHLAELWADVLRRASQEDHVADLETVVTAAAGSLNQRIVVASFDGEFAGAVHLEATTMSPLNLEPVVRAVSPHVLPRFQRHGIGTALMEAAVSWAEELGIGHVATAATAGSRDANRFRARIGLGPYAVLRVATTHVVRARIALHHRHPGRPVGGRQLTQVLAARRSLRRSRAEAAAEN
jgi:GNAT superfamily N-acetyltransferase